MKNIYTTVIVLCTTAIIWLLNGTEVKAQNIGINSTGATPAASAMLDVSSANRGVLIPRVSLTGSNDATTVAAPATSLMVYNTATVNSGATSVSPGFYFWNGSEWLRFVTGAANGWLLTGNTVATTDYIGTNNFESFKINVNGSANRIGLFHPNGSVFFGLNSTGNLNHAFALGLRANAGSSQSIAIGTDALTDVSNGYQSVAIGQSTITRSANSFAIGDAATTGTNAYRSIALGAATIANGPTSIAIGSGASTNASDATALGSSASATSSDAMALGKQAVAAFGASTAIGFQASTGQYEAIVLGNSSSSNARVGIGTNTPNNKLEITQGTAGNSGLRLTNLPNASLLKTSATGDIINQTTPFADNGLFWGLTGNSGTVAGTNFIGTTDAVDLTFKRNNVLSGMISATNTALGTLTFTNVTGVRNTAMGTQSLQNVAAGNNNTAHGAQSLQNTIGTENTAIGYRAGFTNTTGNFNSFLGVNSDATVNNLTKSVAIGYNAKVATSSSFILGGTGADAVKVGIGTTSPVATLDIVGAPTSTTVVDGIIAPRLTGTELKAKDAIYTATQAGAIVYITAPLTTATTSTKTENVTAIGYYYFDGTIWQDFVRNVLFDANLGTGAGGTTNATIAATGFNTVPLPTVSKNIGGGIWNTTNNTYEIPVSGTYLIKSSIRLVDGSASRNVFQAVNLSNIDVAEGIWGTNSGNRWTMLYNRIAYFTKGDLLRLYIYSDGAIANLSDASLNVVLIGR